MTMIVELDASALSQATKGMASTAGIVTTLGSHTFNVVFDLSRVADFFELPCRQKTGAKPAHESSMLPEFALQLFADAGEIKSVPCQGSYWFLRIPIG